MVRGSLMFFEKIKLNEEFMKAYIEKEITSPVNSIVICKYGVENLTALINTDLVVRFSFINRHSIYCEQAEKLILREINFVNYLFEHQANTLKFLDFNKQKIRKIDHEDGMIFVTVTNFLKGTHASYSKRNIEKIATLQAGIHTISRKIDLDKLNDLELYSAMAFRTPDCAEVAKDYRHYLELYGSNRNKIISLIENENKIIIHNDLKSDNIIEKDGSLNIIDFFDCRYSVASEDLGVFIWDLCDKNDNYYEDIDLYLDSYTKQVSLSEIEIELAYRYAIDRYLNINLFYLKKNKYDAGKLKYQKNKFDIQKRYVDFLNRELKKME